MLGRFAEFWRTIGRGCVYAWNGLVYLVASQPNARLHLAATLLVFALAAALRVERWEWCLLWFSVATVWIAEAINTVLELFLDVVKPEQNELVGRAKDVSAAAVTLACVAALATGLLIFVPALWRVFAR